MWCCVPGVCFVQVVFCPRLCFVSAYVLSRWFFVPGDVLSQDMFCLGGWHFVLVRFVWVTLCIGWRFIWLTLCLDDSLCSVSWWRPHKVDKRMVLEYTHGLFIT
jgi:hypothetical protein